MTKQQFIEAIGGLPGVGAKKAEALYEAGFHTVDALRAATKEQLLEVKGVGPKVADAIIEGLKELGSPKAKPEIEVVERAEAEKPEAAKAAAPRVHKARLKPSLDAATQALLLKRQLIKARQPRFIRQSFFRYKKLKERWHKPRGLHSKLREHLNYRMKPVKVGYRVPEAVRGVHPSGFREVLVHRPQDLSKIDPKLEAARIAHGVGARKRSAVLSEAAKMGIRVLNPGGA
ncbi:MAG: 50S ribosomal protein L32e [Methanobacteriota archaeon]